ncbi:hypothetical protein J6590_029544 [Homalodisca vitripennis]|nr:hypothetical protein J6590_029544 [Homalodisca vitripennis]
MQYLSATRDSTAKEERTLILFKSDNQKSLGGESGFVDANVRDANFRQQHVQLNSRQGSLGHRATSVVALHLAPNKSSFKLRHKLFTKPLKVNNFSGGSVLKRKWTIHILV